MRDEKGAASCKFQHICWDGCMFPNATMMKPQTWNSILATMIAVQDRHGRKRGNTAVSEIQNVTSR